MLLENARMKAPESNPPGALALGLLLLPFYLNDAANIFIWNPVQWIALDLAVRIAILTLAFAVVRKFSIWNELFARPRVGAARTTAWLLTTTVTVMMIVVGPGRSLAELWPETQAASLPVISAPGWRVVDLSLGLALVALSEEVVFRGIVLPTFVDGFRSRALAVVLQAALFGAAHWSLGAGAILQTSLAGLALGICTLGCRNLLPAIVAHYVVDLVAFA
jgi:membrane protease YdiL (CAAX protease family)